MLGTFLAMYDHQDVLEWTFLVASTTVLCRQGCIITYKGVFGLAFYCTINLTMVAMAIC